MKKFSLKPFFQCIKYFTNTSVGTRFCASTANIPADADAQKRVPTEDDAPFFRIGLKFLTAALAVISAFASQAEEPIFSFKTTLYADNGASNAFHFYVGATAQTYLDVDCGFGEVEFEVAPTGGVDSETEKLTATMFSGSVSEAGEVKVYGDASLINYLDLEGLYITDLDISRLTNLEYLCLNHNELRALDLSPNTKVMALYVNDNPFTQSPLKVGPKPGLKILEMNIVGDLDPSFSLRDYPELLSADLYAVPSLTVCDPTACPNLLKLSLDVTNVAALDVTKNPNLLILNITDTKISEIDVTQNPLLTEFYCEHIGSFNPGYKLKSLDVTKCPELQRFYCGGNELKSLDVSKNPKLINFSCSHNLLPGIDLSNNPNLYQVDISKNLMDFNTMPLPSINYGEYYYSQQPMPLARSYAEMTDLDFSARVIRPGSYTSFALMKSGIDEDGNNIEIAIYSKGYDPDTHAVIEEGDLEVCDYNDGLVTLRQALPDSVYMAFYNDLFPEYDLQTTKFRVKSAADFGKDSPVITFTPSEAGPISFKVDIIGATADAPKRFAVDFGNGEPVDFTTASAATGTATGTVIVYMPEGEDIAAFTIDGVAFDAINLAGAASLRTLSITNCGLPSIDLGWNRCLRSLDLSGNALTALNLDGADGNNYKTTLDVITARNNRIATFTNAMLCASKVDLSGNLLTSFPTKQAANLRELYLANNRLTALDLEDNENLQVLDLSGNILAELPLPDYLPLQSLNISGNKFPLSTLPVNAAPTYVYAPQQTWSIPAKAPSVNLSMQNVTIDGQSTVYTWFDTAGNQIPADKISGRDGVFQFPDVSLGRIYCTFTHPAFPDFDSKPYRTSLVTPTEMPTNVIASFKTLTSGQGEISMAGVADNTTFYIDWSGMGDLEQYVLKPTYTTFKADTKAGADVKVYTYEEADGITVFSLSVGPLEYLDASALKGLATFSINDAQLTADRLQMPQSQESLYELILNGNRLTDIELAKPYRNIGLLNVSDNLITGLDLSPFPELQGLYATGNELTEVKFANPKLWNVMLGKNQLASIDFSGAPNIDQLWLNDNLLTEIDLSGLAWLKVLDLGGNRFNFNTLPGLDDKYFMYGYSNQQQVAATCTDDARVDLSQCGATEFHWFIGDPYLDEEGNLAGEELVAGEEYIVEGGVTTFLRNFTHVICVMQNPAFPDLYLLSDFLDIRGAQSGIVEQVSRPATTIYDLQGRRVANPTHGIYIINGKKIRI